MFVVAHLTFEVTWILLLSRFKVLGPDGSNYSSPQEAIFGSSDADDAWLAIQYGIDRLF